MSQIVFLGAGIGGMSAAYEIKAALGAAHRVTVVGESCQFSVAPSTPWVGIGWRTAAQVQIDAVAALTRRDIEFVDTPAAAVRPAENRVLLKDGRELDYDYLVITTGPRLAFKMAFEKYFMRKTRSGNTDPIRSTRSTSCRRSALRASSQVRRRTAVSDVRVAQVRCNVDPSIDEDCP